jgi:8-oxo-dGTP pyrophosphatase MutT (NUDIX family)
VWPPSPETLKTLLELPGLDGRREGARQAAVAGVLRQAGEDLEVLMIRRAVFPGDPWSGHVALPGGHAHAGDLSLLATAQRETREEVGIDLERSAELLGRLGEQSPMTGMALTVTPFFFALRDAVSLELSREVEEAFWVPLGPIAQGVRDSTYRLERGGASLSFPAWQVGRHEVWGLTYRLLSELLQRIRAAGSAP